MSGYVSGVPATEKELGVRGGDAEWRVRGGRELEFGRGWFGHCHIGDLSHGLEE